MAIGNIKPGRSELALCAFLVKTIALMLAGLTPLVLLNRYGDHAELLHAGCFNIGHNFHHKAIGHLFIRFEIDIFIRTILKDGGQFFT